MHLAGLRFVDHWPHGKDYEKDTIGCSTLQVDFALAMMILQSEPPSEVSHVVKRPLLVLLGRAGQSSLTADGGPEKESRLEYGMRASRAVCQCLVHGVVLGSSGGDVWSPDFGIYPGSLAVSAYGRA